MNKIPHFRLKMFFTMVLTLFCSLILQERTWFHAGDVFLKQVDFDVFLTGHVLPSLGFALPVFITLSLVFILRLSGLHRVVARLSQNDVVPEDDLHRAQNELTSLQTWVFLTVSVSVLIGLVMEFIRFPEEILTLSGLFKVLFSGSEIFLISFFLLGIFNTFLAEPRARLKVTSLDQVQGKVYSYHNRQMLFGIAFAAYLLLFGINLSVKYMDYQNRYSQSLERIAAGEDKTKVSQEFFDHYAKAHPHAADSFKNDITNIKPRMNDLDLYFGPTFFVLLFLAGGVYFFSTRYQTIQLKRLRDRTAVIVAGGDMSKPMEIIQKDEVGEITAHINQLMALQNRRIIELKAAAAEVAEASTTLTKVIAETAGAGRKIEGSTGKIQQLAEAEQHAVKKSEQNLQEVLASFESISQRVDDQNRYVQDSSSAMTEMASSIASVTKTTQEARSLTDQLKSAAAEGSEALTASIQAMQRIEAASQEVNALTLAIAKISAQTNLLAMNAAIEAAHAGEAGAGFAVVAQEVRNLAVSSAESNKKIKNKTKEMLDLVISGAKLSADAGASFQKISTDITQTSALVSEIASAMQEQNVGTSQILESTTALVEASQKIRDTAREQRQQNEKLKEAVTKVASSFQTISQASRDASEDAGHIQSSVAALSEVSTQNHKTVEHLTSIVTSMGGSDKK